MTNLAMFALSISSKELITLVVIVYESRANLKN